MCWSRFFNTNTGIARTILWNTSNTERRKFGHRKYRQKTIHRLSSIPRQSTYSASLDGKPIKFKYSIIIIAVIDERSTWGIVGSLKLIVCIIERHPKGNKPNSVKSKRKVSRITFFFVVTSVYVCVDSVRHRTKKKSMLDTHKTTFDTPLQASVQFFLGLHGFLRGSGGTREHHQHYAHVISTALQR